MTELKTFLVTFIIVYIIYFIVILVRSKGREKLKESSEAKFLKNRFQLNLDTIKPNVLGYIIAFANSLILALTLTFISLFDNYLFKMIIGFIILIILQLIIYTIIGKYLKQKERGKKDV